jgi:polysaccharide biosynthesis protein PslG
MVQESCTIDAALASPERRRGTPWRILAALLAGICTASAAPVDVGPPIPAAYFGMHVLNYSEILPEFRVGALRTWDAYPGLGWTDINPSEGQYDFSGMDDYLGRVRRLNADIVFVFGRTPRWVSAKPSAKGPYGPGQCAPPADLRHWDAFVRAVVTHAAGRIHHWEIWNEPQDPDFYCGDIDTMVAMTRRAQAIIKGIDPNAKVLSPSPTGWQPGGPAAPWLDRFLARDGGRYADIIAFHGYGTLVPERINPIVASLRAVLARHGQADKPIWNTEASWAGSEGIAPVDLDLRAAYVARSYLLSWSLGVKRFYWYAYDGDRWGGLRSASGTLLLDGVAFRTTYDWLVGASESRPCAASGTVWTCGYQRPGGYRALAVWTTSGDLPFTVPPDYARYQDLRGRSRPVVNGAVRISTMPILLEGGTAASRH